MYNTFFGQQHSDLYNKTNSVHHENRFSGKRIILFVIDPNVIASLNQVLSAEGATIQVPLHRHLYPRCTPLLLH